LQLSRPGVPFSTEDLTVKLKLSRAEEARLDGLVAAGRGVVVWRGADGRLRLVVLPADGSPIAFGRDVPPPGRLDDPKASRRHCLVFAADASWYVQDDGSSNGTIISGSAIRSRTAIADRTPIQVGDTTLLARLPDLPPSALPQPRPTPIAPKPINGKVYDLAELDGRLRKALAELCAPRLAGGRWTATNAKIAMNLSLAERSVKGYITALIDFFDVDERQPHPREEVADRAIASGIGTPPTPDSAKRTDQGL
jgi:hypothetical protein